ncbi:hypothetical protein GCM10022251_13550 [Phytohabitans flavus]|uniref:Uncharacterized protein n=1 Tax=Phytohabitans flavus TaxID=1076124 RepID=A0A6F8XJ30_9ACTN|nr:hypothetical protein [Phytohabitans flavus]BCB73820.1 hypothetical protein Pflav_002300 [Phytohabitans flavus]
MHDTWVPVERRWFGFDRTTIKPALLVLGLAVVLALVVPAVDSAVPTGTRVTAGDVVVLAGRIQFTPATGWQLTDGNLRGEEPRAGDSPTATVVNGPVTFAVKTGPFTGTPLALLEQIKKTTDALHGKHGLHVTGNPSPIQTNGGDQGVIARYRGTSSDGALAAFVIQGTGVEAVVTGPPGATQGPAQQINSMFTSIGAEPGGQR